MNPTQAKAWLGNLDRGSRLSARQELRQDVARQGCRRRSQTSPAELIGAHNGSADHTLWGN